MIIPYSEDSYRFHTISEFQTSMRYGAEVVIGWNGVKYGIWSEDKQIRVTCTDYSERNQVFDTSNVVLEFRVGSDRLRDVITQVTVPNRMI